MKTEELLRYRAMYREMRDRLEARYIVYAFPRRAELPVGEDPQIFPSGPGDVEPDPAPEEADGM